MGEKDNQQKKSGNSSKNNIQKAPIHQPERDISSETTSASAPLITRSNIPANGQPPRQQNLLSLQRRVGNKHVTHQLTGPSSPSIARTPLLIPTVQREEALEDDIQPEEVEEVAQTLQRSTAAAGSPPDEDEDLTIQAKMQVNEPNDQYEQEADAVASQVMRMGDEEEIQLQPISTDIQRKGASTPEVTPEIEQGVSSLQSGGSPLPDGERQFFESRMGADFSNVRIHNDSKSTDLSNNLEARAFTVGNSIAFNEGEYQPGSASGRELLAHELTHVVQQGAAPKVQRSPEEEEGICPTCGKSGKKGETCSGCGQVFRSVKISHTEADFTVQRRTLDSLSGVPTSQFAGAFNEVVEAAPQMQAEQKTALEQSLPEIEQPTGLPTKDQQTDLPPGQQTQLNNNNEAEMQMETGGEQTPIDPVHPEPAAPVPGSNINTVVQEPAAPAEGQEGDDGWFGWFNGALQNFLGSLPTTDPSVSTSAGERPKVELTGEANPEQMATHRQESDAETTKLQNEADASTLEDFGENDIYPDITKEMMRPQHQISTAETAGVASVELQTLQADAQAEFDATSTPLIEAEVAPEIAKDQAEYQNYQNESTTLKEQSHQDIQQANSQAQLEQEAEQQEAKSEVDAQREQWREENAKIQTEYQNKADAERQKIDEQISTKVEETDVAVDTKLTEAEEEAEREKQAAEEEASRKKEESENKDEGFWGSLRGAVSDFFDGLKEAVNAIFEGLRNLVKTIIEEAKKIVNDLIDMARDAIVGFIKGFGEFLKGLIDIALAAFPEVAEKAKAWIDNKVQQAEELVNTIAEGLNKTVAFILDTLGQALDNLLALYQAMYNLIIDVLHALTIGILEAMERLGYLVEAATQMPDHFWGQASEELLGTDVTQPLPFERTAEMCEVSDASLVEDSQDNELTALLNQDEFTEDNFSVDGGVGGFDASPELLDSLGMLEGDGTVEFDGNNDQTNSMEGILSEITGSEPTSEEASAEASIEEEPGSLCDDETSAQAKLDQMMAQKPEGAAETTSKPEETVFPDDMKVVGPLTVGQRIQFVTNQMKQGIQDWFAANWPVIALGAIAALAIFVGANIISGGLATAAIPVIMPYIMALMIGVTAYQVMGHVASYLSKGWEGDIVGAAKSLARAIAIGVIELLSEVIFSVAGKVLSVIKNGLKSAMKGATKGAKAVGKTVSRVAKGSAKFVSEASPALFKNGKIVLEGVSNGIGKAVKSADDLITRLKNKLRFNKFKIERQGDNIQLFGHVNPWVLLAQGEIQSFDKKPKKGDAVWLDDDQYKELMDGKKPKTGKLEEFQATNYKNSTSSGSGEVGDNLTGDHIPSRAAVEEYLIEQYKKAHNGRSPKGKALEDIQKQAKDQGVVVTLKNTTHEELSRTFGGRNSATQITQDASDLGQAFINDAEAILSGLHSRGELTHEILGAYHQAYKLNVQKGLFKVRPDIDNMFTNYLKIL